VPRTRQEQCNPPTAGNAERRQRSDIEAKSRLGPKANYEVSHEGILFEKRLKPQIRFI
jgi:hypothetical protein